MFKRIFLLLFTLLFTVFAGVACSSKDDESETQNNAVEESENEERSTDDDDEINSDEDTEQQGDDSNTEAREPSSNRDTELPETIDINEEIITDTGLIFILEKISFEDDHIAVDFHADNNSGFKIYLAVDGAAYGQDLGGVTLQDNTGFDYRYVAASGDSMIGVANQETVDGTIRFLGKVRDDAKTITLIFNPEKNEDDDSAPIFTFESIEIPW